MSSISYTHITFLCSQEKWHVTVINIVHFMTKKRFSGRKVKHFNKIIYKTLDDAIKDGDSDIKLWKKDIFSIKSTIIQDI